MVIRVVWIQTEVFLDVQILDGSLLVIDGKFLDRVFLFFENLTLLERLLRSLFGYFLCLCLRGQFIRHIFCRLLPGTDLGFKIMGEAFQGSVGFQNRRQIFVTIRSLFLVRISLLIRFLPFGTFSFYILRR